jgi:parallel beta-helix repeat protein
MPILKTLTFSAALILTCCLRSQNYYISSTDPLANDANAGTSPSLPWLTFRPLDTLSAISTADTILLKRGDMFRDSMFINNANGLVITGYGAGADPIISGSDPISGWAFQAARYQANFSQQPIAFFVNDREQIIARTPDEGLYNTIEAADTTYLKDGPLQSITTGDLLSSWVCVHTKQWCWEKSAISAVNNDTIFYQNTTRQAGNVNYGYFLYNDSSYLDAPKEWWYNSSLQRIYFIPQSGNPNTYNCEASVRAYGIRFGVSASNILISGIAFEEQAACGVFIPLATNNNISVDDCSFERQYIAGVQTEGTATVVSNCSFTQVDGLAIYLTGTATYAEIHHNVFSNNGTFRNSGVGEEINGSAIKGAYVDNCHIHHNVIDSTGYCGISMDGSYNLIERNIVSNAMLLNNDGAPLKAFGVASQYSTFRNNFVSSSEGNTEGTFSPDFVTPGIYFDFKTNNCTIENNTVYNHNGTGIFQNSGTQYNTIRGNVVYASVYGYNLNGAHPNLNTPLQGMDIKHNYFFVTEPTSFVMRHVDYTGNYNLGTIDSNVYFHPYSTTQYVFREPSTPYTFPLWQNEGFDANSRPAWVNWTFPQRFDTLIMNQTDNAVTVNLGNTEYLDLDSNIVCGSITLQPYTSRILINTQNTCSPSAIEESSVSGISYFPNPAAEILRFTEQQEYIRVYSLVGELMLETYNTLEINVSGFPAGIYILQTNNGTGRFCKAE